jgi:radical SAM protein with 4Fe4S-binding SPASM domain
MSRSEANGASAAEANPMARPFSFDWEEARRTGINPLPVRVLQIETSSICNFRCPSCPLALPDYDRPEKHMSTADFLRILDAYPDAAKVELQGIGEVFLNPCVLDIVRAARARGVAVHTFSNASKIERDTAREIVDSGLAHVNFSLDGADEATFRKLRKGGTLKRYKRCVTNLLQARALAGSPTPTVGVMTVLSKLNYRQIPRMIAIAEELGVDSIVFTKINAGPNPELEGILLGESERAWIKGLPPYRGRVEAIWAYTPWTREERMACYWPQHMSYVTVEGDVTPCCNYFDSRELKLGNAFAQSGAEIWNGEPTREFRKRLLAGDLPPKCRTC